MTNTRWKRLKHGKYGRMSILQQSRDDGLWDVWGWYLDGEMTLECYNSLKSAREAQQTFLRGGRL